MKPIPSFSKIAIDWYEENQRQLPWRGETDPYKIWISEIILQQTRVKQGWEYYLKFIDRFPNVQSLSFSPLQEVLHVWQGLGYYTRARNLHIAAQQIMHHHNGVFPENYVDIKKLKGIGNYTAAAIASIAFQLSYPAVDGNVLRVISRVFGIYDDIAQPKTVHEITLLCEKLIDNKNPGAFNQALMELGAIQCTPKKPKCTTCPLAAHCVAFEKEHTHRIPFKFSKNNIKERFFQFVIFMKEGKTIIEQRMENDIWKNLFQFPMLDTKQIPVNAVFLKEVKHKLTHQHLTIHFYVVNEYFPEMQNQWFVISIDDLEKFPFPVVLKNILYDIRPGMTKF